MVQLTRMRWWLVGLAVMAGLIALIVYSARTTDPQYTVKRMQSQVAQLRGLQFKRDVVMQEQSQAEFQKSAIDQLQRLGAPESEQVLRTLGLLASDETLGMDGLEKHIETGPTGYYDPYSARLFVVGPRQPQPAVALDDMYARELYRALLDQHFDLKTYLERRQSEGELNNDERLARQMIVEGEAFYSAVLRRVKQEVGHIPKYLPIEEAFDRYKTDELMNLRDDPRLRKSAERPKRRRDPDDLPTYVTQIVQGMQRDGVLFVDELRDRGGWAEFEKLYTSAPPVSTEQILHPQKWFVRERPAKIQWPAFESNAAFADWQLLEQDVLGEFLLRTVFRVHRLSSMMGSSPAGWNGDRYAVFKRRDSGDMLLLLYTAWDKERDAAEFAKAYRVIVKEKYGEATQPVRIVEEGRRVVIVEGGDEASLDAFVRFAQSAQEIPPETGVEK